MRLHSILAGNIILPSPPDIISEGATGNYDVTQILSVYLLSPISLIKMQHNPLQISFQHDLDLLFRVDRLYEDGVDAGAVCAVYIGKKLVTDKQCILRIGSHHLHRLPVILHGRLVCVFDKFHVDILIEQLDPRQLIIGEQATVKTNLLQMAEQFFCPLVCRRPVRDERIVNVKNNAPIPCTIQGIEVYDIGRIQIFIRIKATQ